MSLEDSVVIGKEINLDTDGALVEVETMVESKLKHILEK